MNFLEAYKSITFFLYVLSALKHHKLSSGYNLTMRDLSLDKYLVFFVSISYEILLFQYLGYYDVFWLFSNLNILSAEQVTRQKIFQRILNCKIFHFFSKQIYFFKSMNEWKNFKKKGSFYYLILLYIVQRTQQVI